MAKATVYYFTFFDRDTGETVRPRRAGTLEAIRDTGLASINLLRRRIVKKLMRPRTCVVFQEPSKPFTAVDQACTLCVWTDSRKEERIALPLMIPLMMKMRHILRQRMAQ